MKRARNALTPILCAALGLGTMGFTTTPASADDRFSFSISYGGNDRGYRSNWNSHAGTLWIGNRSYTINNCDDVARQIARTLRHRGLDVCIEGATITIRRQRYGDRCSPYARRMPSISWTRGSWCANFSYSRECITICLRPVPRAACPPRPRPRRAHDRDRGGWNNGWSRGYRSGRTYYRDRRHNRPHRYDRDDRCN